MKPSMRLDKMLARLGIGTRSAIRHLVRQGAVTVNGQLATDPGMHVRPAADVVRVNGETVRYREFRWIMLHKPAGVVSATEDARERTALDLLPDEWRRFRLFPVGRLDKDTEGLLLLTDDGKQAHDLLSPRKHVPKTYRALVLGDVGPEDAAAFAAGVTLDDGYVTMPAALTVLDKLPSAAAAETDRAPAPSTGARVAAPDAAGGSEIRQAIARLESEPALRRARDMLRGEAAPLSWVELVIREGKFHQVKRMFAARGKPVLYLRRVAMGGLRLDESLRPGQWRELTPGEELALLTKPGPDP